MHDLDWIRTKDSPKELFIDEDLTTFDEKMPFQDFHYCNILQRYRIVMILSTVKL